MEAVLDLAKGFGTSAPIVALLLYFVWDRDRKYADLLKSHLDLLPKVTSALEGNTATLDRLSDRLPK
jgi:hypothetical protein